MAVTSVARLAGVVALVALGCGPPVREADHGSVEHAPRWDTPPATRGRLLDVRGEALAAGGRGARAVSAPASLAPWVGGMTEIDGTELGASGLEERFEGVLTRGEDVRVSFDAALHRRLEAGFGDLPHAAVAVIDLESHGIRALFATDEPRGEVHEAHRATATMAPPGFTVAPFAALALLAREPPPRAETVARALEGWDEGALRRLAVDLDQEHLARAQIAFGLGIRSGLWRGEVRGTIPRRLHGAAPQSPEPTADQAMGLGALRCTPLQLARAYATLATGKLARLSLRADGRPTLDPLFEDEWSRLEPDFVRALGAYAPHLEVVRDALRGTLAAGRTGPAADLVGACGTAAAPRDGAEVTFAWCAGVGGEPAIAFAAMAEGSTRERVLDAVRAWRGREAR